MDMFKYLYGHTMGLNRRKLEIAGDIMSDLVFLAETYGVDFRPIHAVLESSPGEFVRHCRWLRAEFVFLDRYPDARMTFEIKDFILYNLWGALRQFHLITSEGMAHYLVDQFSISLDDAYNMISGAHPSLIDYLYVLDYFGVSFSVKIPKKLRDKRQT